MSGVKRELNQKYSLAIIIGTVIGQVSVSNFPSFSRQQTVPAWQLMAVLAVIFQVLLFGTFTVFTLDGILAAPFLILTGLPVYCYFRHKQSKFLEPQEG